MDSVALVARARAVFSEAFSAWGRLVPSALKCTGSLAGCDFWEAFNSPVSHLNLRFIVAICRNC